MTLHTPSRGRDRFLRPPRTYTTRDWDQRLLDYRNAILDREHYRQQMKTQPKTYTVIGYRRLDNTVDALHHELITDIIRASDPSWGDGA